MAAAVSLLLFACAAASNAVMDTLSFRYNKSVFSRYPAMRNWADPGVSWKNKWKNGDPAQGEAFFLSSTALVALTDAWHLFKSIAILCVLLAIMAPFTEAFKLHWGAWIVILAGMKLVYGIIFESMFTFFLIK